jgi:hypothetical protein
LCLLARVKSSLSSSANFEWKFDSFNSWKPRFLQKIRKNVPIALIYPNLCEMWRKNIPIKLKKFFRVQSMGFKDGVFFKKVNWFFFIWSNMASDVQGGRQKYEWHGSVFYKLLSSFFCIELEQVLNYQEKKNKSKMANQNLQVFNICWISLLYCIRIVLVYLITWKSSFY